jgi:hypothetical protein
VHNVIAATGVLDSVPARVHETDAVPFSFLCHRCIPASIHARTGNCREGELQADVSTVGPGYGGVNGVKDLAFWFHCARKLCSSKKKKIFVQRQR